MAILLKELEIKCNGIKIQMLLFTEIGKSIPKFIWKNKKHQISKAILSKKSNARGCSSDFKLYYKTTAKNSMILAQNHKKQLNRIEDPYNCKH
jgi:hypothetical protein